MKKLIISSFLFIFFISTGYPQNYNWITPNTPYLKMYIIEDGMYRIDKSDFTNAGINTSSIDPRTVKVFYKGNQIPIYFHGEDDGIFHDTDYFDFYGRRNYGGLTNTYNVYNQVSYVTDEYYNFYSDTNSYWVGWGGSYGLRYENFSYSVTTSYPLNYFKEKLHFEIDLIYSLGVSTGDGDYRNFMNDKFEGEGWYWKQMQYNNTHTQTFLPINLQTTSDQFEFKIFAYPINYSSSVSLEHRITIRLNNNLIDTVKSEDLNRIDTTRFFPGSFFTAGSNNTITLKYTPPSTFSSAKIYLDMFEITYPRKFQFDSNKLSFRDLTVDSTSKQFKISGFIPSNNIFIYDNNNGYRITNYTYNADTLIFTGKGNGNFEVYNKPITKKPLRIKQKQVPNLVSTSNGVDYLIIYNKLFESQAEQLRQYRATHNSFRAFKAEVEDIYDIFNYGIEDPVALRRFVKYVYQYWQAPAIKYICLFGRGSIDPKRINSTAPYYKNLVPVYGNPVTDGYFANLNEGSFTYIHHIRIGRLPAYTTDEAQTMVNKIIAYESESLDKWVKNAVMMTGGYYYDDQQANIATAMYFINNYIHPPPLSMATTKIFLNDSLGRILYDYQDSVIVSLNQGALLANYTGHAGNGYWDFCFNDPYVLNNMNRLPLIFSMTCFTGKFAEYSSRGYGEKFLTYENKGAIGFVSTTGWSFSSSGNTFNDWLWDGISNDSLRYFGDIIRNANFKMSSDSGSFPVRNTINCYNLIGDPACKLLLPTYAEFDINQSDYVLSNQFPSINEKINIKFFPKNLGTHADSCKIRFLILKNNQTFFRKDTVVYSFKFIDTLNYNVSIDSAGAFTVKLILDVDNWYINENESNNSISFSLNIKNFSFTQLKPIDNQVIYNDSVDIVVINPGVDFSNNSAKLIFQLDTNYNFNSPALQTYFNNNPQGVITHQKIKIPILDSNIIYFWRTNCIINNVDTAGWTGYKRFRYSPNKTIDSSLTIVKSKINQYLKDDFNNTKCDTAGIILKNYTYNLEASSYGGNTFDPSYFLINKKVFYYVSEPDWNGLAIAKVRKTDAYPIEIKHITFHSASSSDSVLAFLNSFDTNHILMAIKLIPMSCNNNLNTATRNKFKEFGSTKIDSLNIVSWMRWSFISYKIDTTKYVSESFAPGGWGPVFSNLFCDFMPINGNLAQTFGPAANWKNFNWAQILYPKTNIKFDVFGITLNNQQVLLYQDLTSNNFVSLDTVNAYIYPYLKLISKLSIDTSGSFGEQGIYGGIPSPVLKSLTFNYIPPAELAIDYSSLIRSDSLINENDSIGISVRYYNVGFKSCYGSIRQAYFYRGNEKITLNIDTSYKIINVDSSESYKKYVKFSGLLPPFRKSNEKIVLYFEVSPLGNQNEIYTYNNIINTDVFIRSNIVPGQLELYADGIKLQGGEYVRKNSEFTIKYLKKDNIPYTLLDTSLFKIYVNGKLHSFGDKKIKNKDISESERITGKREDYQLDKEKSGFEQINLLSFYPDLSEGENIVKLLSRRTVELPFDTNKYVVLVSNELFVKDLYNYPNPMKNETAFMFTLAGNMVFDCKIKIYTVSGKLIKTINSPVNIGYNQIYWDGRDDDGDEVANGVYFYKLIIEGDGKKETPIQKLVVLK